MNGRKAFVDAPTREAALRTFAWATAVVELDSGWIAFEDEIEAALWRAQTYSPTGRLHSPEPNTQGIPIRTEEVRRIKLALVS